MKYENINLCSYDIPRFMSYLKRHGIPFDAKFRKRSDGSERTYQGVTVDSLRIKEDLVIVDIGEKGFRSLALESVQSIRIGSRMWTFAPNRLERGDSLKFVPNKD